ncbi:MAG: T9SS type A sorting domain-containing protein [Bacteroidota bacterium]
MDYLLSIDGFTQECDNDFGTFCVETNTDVFDPACIQDFHFELELVTGNFEPDDALILQSGWNDECISAPAMKPIEVQTNPKVLNLRVFPNPAEETITLQLPPELRSDQALTLEVMDSRGSRVLTQTLPGDVATHRQVVDQLPSGVYVLFLFDQGRELLVQQRFVKQ